MTPRPNKNARPALSTRRPGGNLRHDQFYPGAAVNQSSDDPILTAGEQFAARWREAAACFSSAFYRALTDPPMPCVAAVIQAARDENLQLTADDFPPGFWPLIAVLIRHAECGIRPDIDSVLSLAARWDEALPIGGGGVRAELREILEREASAAGLLSWAHELKACARKARQFHRLHRRLGALVGAPIEAVSQAPVAATATPASVRRFSARAIAAVMEGER